MEDSKDNRKVIVTFLAIVIIAAIVVAAAAASPKKKTTDTSSTQPASSNSNNAGSTRTPAQSASTASTSGSSFKDGSYTATGSYESPGGTEGITVHVTLKNDVITATSAQSGAQDPDASSYQEVFISSYKSLVVGKNIADVNLSRVSGSSLTSQGFNDAIQQIENQAKA